MKKDSDPKIIVGMPAYNEGKYIGSLVLQARQYADEVIVVDDGSVDLTAEIAELAGATVVRHSENSGYGAAIQSIFAEFQKRDAELLVIFDADAQHNPAEISSLVKPLSEGYDIVIGSRIEQKKEIPLYRRIGQRFLSRLTRVASKKTVYDTESGFRAYSRKAIDMLELKEKGMAISAEIVAAAADKGLSIAEVPISITYSEDSSTLHPVKHGLSVMNRIMVMISERRPLLVFGTVGVISLVFGIAAGFIVVFSFYSYGGVLATGTALISMLLVTIGILCISTGMILSVLVKRLGDSFRH